MSICGSIQSGSSRGTVTLVALCFVAVLGITIASYIAVCSRAMNLSNRSYQVMTSQQLAELGIDEALRAFNKNDWSNWTTSPTNVTAGSWTLDTTNKRATRTITFNSPKLGQGVTGSVKIRVDNYDAAQLASIWSSSANYRTNDLVGYNGLWYRCLQNHSNQTPGNLAYWAQAPIPWAWSSNTSYTQNTGTTNNSVIFDGTTWYFCNTSHPSGSTWSANAANWTAMAPPTLAWTSSTSYSVNQQVYNTSDNRWYRCRTAHTSTSSFDSANFDQGTVVIAWRWQSSHVYAYNQVVYYNQIWYRCIVPSSSGNTPGISSDWENALTGMFGWSGSGLKYNVGDSVFYSTTGQRYRCLVAHTSSGSILPTNTAYWANTPAYSTQWESNRQYSQNDTVRYNGVWYLSRQNSNTGRNPVTATTWWIGANTTTASYQWNATTAYAVGDYRCYGGVWYRCTAATTANAGHSPNNTSYWTPSWANSWGITTGAPVVYAEGTVAITGSPSVRTQLRATIAPAPLFPNAVASTTTISANSGGTVDSYDSTTGTVALQPGVTSTAGTSNTITGTYASHVGTSTNHSAVVAAGSTSGTAVSLTTTAVNGYVAAPSSSTTPFAPLFSSGGSVKGFTSPVSPNIDLTRISRSPYIPQFDTIPGGAGGLATNWATTPKGTQLVLAPTINIGTPGAVTPSRYFVNGPLTIGTAGPPIVSNLRIIGPVILYVNGDLFITASGGYTGRIDITSTGSAEIHVAGRFMADLGGEGIQNYTSDPKSLIIICDTTSTSTHFYSEGPNDLYGVIYIPYSTSATGFTNDNNLTEIFGAVSANRITYSGANMNIHYDTSLRYATFGGVDQPFAVTEWRELPQTELATMP